MWSLEHTSGKLIHIPLLKKEIQIGRNASSDLCLISDQSVSRHHAKVSVYKNSINNNDSICEITDHGSRFSTYISRDDTEIKLTASQPYQLQPNDKIKFGAGTNIWTVKYTKLCILTCGHNNDNKKMLHKVIEYLGGTLSNETSSECTHYLSLCTRITPKFIFAVCHGLPIIGKKYWEYFMNSVENNIKLPDVNDYLIMNNCLPTEYKNAPLCSTNDRRQIFNGLIFVFFSVKQCNDFGFVIKTAGGKSSLYHKFTYDKEELLKPNIVIIECSENERNQNPQLINDADYNALQIFLREKNRRMVNSREILGAILFCSTKKYCNSTKKMFNKFWMGSPKKKRRRALRSSGDHDHVTKKQKNNHPGSDTTICEIPPAAAGPSGKSSQDYQVASTSNAQKKDPTKGKESTFANQSKINNGVSLNKAVLNGPGKSTKNSEGIADLKKKGLNQSNQSAAGNRTKDKSGTSSVKTYFQGSGDPNPKTKLKNKNLSQGDKSVAANRNINKNAEITLEVLRDSNKKSSKHNKDAAKLKNKGLNQGDKSVADNPKENKNRYLYAKTTLEASEDSNRRKSIIKESENDKLNKKNPNPQSRAEIRRRKKFEEILGILEDSKKIIPKDKNVENFNQLNLDDGETQKDPNQSNKGIKVVSNVQVKVLSSKNPANVFNVPDPKPSTSKETVENSNKKHLDQDKDSSVKNLQNIAKVSDNLSEKSSGSRKDNKLNKKPKLDEKKSSEVPKKSTQIFHSFEEDFSTITPLDNSVDENQHLDDDYSKIIDKSKDFTDSNKNISQKITDANNEANTSKESEEIFEISSASDKSETDQAKRRRTRSTRSEETSSKRYNLRSQRCCSTETEVHSQANSQSDFCKGVIATSTQLGVNDADPEQIQSREDLKNDSLNSLESVMFDDQDKSKQDDCKIVIVDIQANYKSFEEDFESAIPQIPEDASETPTENNVKANNQVEDDKTASPKKIPLFFQKNKKQS